MLLPVCRLQYCMPSLLVLSHVQGHTTRMGFQKRSLVDALGREQTWNILCSHTCWTQLDFALSQQLYTCDLRRGSRTNMDDWTAKTLAHAWVCTYCLEHNAIMLPQDCAERSPVLLPHACGLRDAFYVCLAGSC